MECNGNWAHRMQTYRIRKCKKIGVCVIFLNFRFCLEFHVINCCEKKERKQIKFRLFDLNEICNLTFTCARIFNSIYKETHYNQQHRTDIQTYTSCSQHYVCILSIFINLYLDLSGAKQFRFFLKLRDWFFFFCCCCCCWRIDWWTEVFRIVLTVRSLTRPLTCIKTKLM